MALKINQPELFRQGWHILLALSFALLWLWHGKLFASQIAVLVFLLGLVLSLAIANGFFRYPFLEHHVRHVSRSHEHDLPGRGALVLMLAILLTFFVFYQFPPLIAFVALVCLALGDGFSTIVGVHFGKIKLMKNRTLEGSLGGFLAALMGLLFFMAPVPAFALALVAALSEFLPVDDNFSIPIFVGFVAIFLI